jgi:hypothetical protein
MFSGSLIAIAESYRHKQFEMQRTAKAVVPTGFLGTLGPNDWDIKK